MDAKSKILDAALALVREHGFNATSVDDLCKKAGVTKGAFFHHFKSKEDLGVQAAAHWSSVTNSFFEHAPYQQKKDPLEKLLSYIDFRKEILKGDIAEFTCLVGTMVQEVYHSSPKIRDACQRSIFGHAQEVAKMIQEAKKIYVPKAKWSAEGLALHTQAVIQGSFILAKSKDDAEYAADCIDHLKRYVEFLFKK